VARQLDETDREILRLLVADARRPYADIGEQVELSGPAVSDRVARLREMGVIRRFTADLDRSLLREGVGLLIDCRPEPSAVEAVRSALSGAEGVEHVFETAEGRVVLTARVPDGDARGFLADRVDLSRLREYDVSVLAGESWSPGLGAAEFAPDCAECGNTVTSEGVSRRLDKEEYHFCCESCASQFVTQYRQLQEGA
jgi:DNA-binding Lrp family transcriptional regulator